MDTTIIAVCRQLEEEAAAIRKYTEDIGAVGEADPDVSVLLKDIRLDELEHVQKLALELTRLLSDADGGEDDDGGGEE